MARGLGNSTQKLGAIPEAQNDMILVVICEELGVFGAIIIFVLFGLLLYRLMFIAKNAPDLYGSLIATGNFCAYCPAGWSLTLLWLPGFCLRQASLCLLSATEEPRFCF